jgi:hypothetical protein
MLVTAADIRGRLSIILFVCTGETSFRVHVSLCVVALETMLAGGCVSLSLEALHWICRDRPHWIERAVSSLSVRLQDANMWRETSV